MNVYDVYQAGLDGLREGRERGLAGLVGKAFNAPQGERQAALSKIAMVDGPAAFKTNEMMSQWDDRKQEALVRAAQMILVTPEEARPQQWQQIVASGVIPGLKPMYDPIQVPEMARKIVAMAQAKGATPAGVQEFQFMSQGLSDEDNLRARRVALGLDPRQSSAAIQYKEVMGPDGVTRLVAVDPRQVGAHVIGEGTTYGSGVGATQMQRAPGEVPFSIDPSLPPQVQAAIRASEAQGRPFDGQMQGQGPSPFASRPEEESAYRNQAAKEAASTQFLPQQEAIKTEAGIARAGGEAEARGLAEARVEAIQNLPRVMTESQNAISLIDKALNHPGREAATGMSGSLDPRNYLPGTDATNFKVLLDQIKGGTFLQAFQALKGGGAITQVEGQKAEQAIARLNTAQSDGEFVQALLDLKSIAERAVTRAQERVNMFGQGAQSGSVGGRGTSDANRRALLDKY